MSNDYRAYVECDYNSIYHHGIKGMKWGVRRYQNKDGSLTPEGRRRYERDALSQMRNTRTKEGIKEIFEDSTRLLDKKKVEKFKSINDELDKVQDQINKNGGYREFWESKECDEMVKEAHKMTMDCLKENAPDLYKTMIADKKKDPKHYDPYMYHDYRKIFEGTEDMILDKYEKKWNDGPGKLCAKYDRLWDRKWKMSRDLTKDVFGDIGDKYLSEINSIADTWPEAEPTAFKYLRLYDSYSTWLNKNLNNSSK